VILSDLHSHLEKLMDEVPWDTPVYTGVAGSRPVHSVDVVTNDDRLGTPGQLEIWLRP